MGVGAALGAVAGVEIAGEASCWAGVMAGSWVGGWGTWGDGWPCWGGSCGCSCGEKTCCGCCCCGEKGCG